MSRGTEGVTALTVPTPPPSSLAAGYTPLPPGQIATLVTFLEMCARPRPKPASLPQVRLELRALDRGDLAGYRRLYAEVGTDWLWFSRLALDDEALAAILGDPAVEPYALLAGGREVGLLELDFRCAHECEIAFFGLKAPAIGKGIGRFMMDRALARAWSRPLRRVWLHTCSFDHPAALRFYQKCGFAPYALAVEVMDDPRLSGFIPRSAAPHVPLLGG